MDLPVDFPLLSRYRTSFLLLHPTVTTVPTGITVTTVETVTTSVTHLEDLALELILNERKILQLYFYRYVREYRYYDCYTP